MTMSWVLCRITAFLIRSLRLQPSPQHAERPWNCGPAMPLVSMFRLHMPRAETCDLLLRWLCVHPSFLRCNALNRLDGRVCILTDSKKGADFKFHLIYFMYVHWLLFKNPRWSYCHHIRIWWWIDKCYVFKYFIKIFWYLCLVVIISRCWVIICYNL